MTFEGNLIENKSFLSKKKTTNKHKSVRDSNRRRNIYNLGFVTEVIYVTSVSFQVDLITDAGHWIIYLFHYSIKQKEMKYFLIFIDVWGIVGFLMTRLKLFSPLHVIVLSLNSYFYDFAQFLKFCAF